MRSLLPLLALLCLLPYSRQTFYRKDLPLTNTECIKCKGPPPVTKCTKCVAPILAMGDITSRCAGTLTCLPGQILIANSRYVVTGVQCSEHSSDGEEVWIGKTTKKKTIAIENAACFTTPISCHAIGSFSTRCPRGFACDPVRMSLDETLITCHKSSWTGWLWDLFHLNVEKKNLWYRDDDKQKWTQITEELKCDTATGAWIETVPVQAEESIATGILTDRIICAQKEFSLFGLVIELELMQTCVLAIQICVPIIVVALLCICKQLRRRDYLRASKKYLDEQYAEGLARAAQLKEAEKGSMRVLTNRWREVNKFVVEKNSPVIAAWKKKGKGKKA